jgi:hypothetical protein
MSNQRNGVIAVCLSLFAASAPAIAHDREGAYVFAGVGSASTEWKAKAGVAPVGQKRNTATSTSSYQVGVGYRVSDYFGVEGSYADMAGQARYQGVGSVEGKSLSMAAVGYLPIGRRFELFAKAGAGRTRYDYQSATGSPGPHTAWGVSSSRLYSLGANYRLNSSLAVRLEWSTLGVSSREFRDAIGADSLGTGQWTAGLSYRF